jgi:hypothetical protein
MKTSERFARPHTLLFAGVAALSLTVAAARPPLALANDVEKLELTPSSAQLAECMPDATLDVRVELDTDKAGFDRFQIRAHHLPPNRDFAVFLLEQAGAPFGAAEYIGDFSTNEHGNGQNTFKLIVQEAFSSTLVDGHRVRVDLNQVGVWFADPAGVQAFNSANTDALPAP